MDPLGFALENFDGIGQWREKDRVAETRIDASGELPDGTPVDGPDDLRKALLARPDQFVQTLTEKLMTYGSAAARIRTTCRPSARSCARRRATTTASSR